MEKILLCSREMHKAILNIFKGFRYDITYIPECKRISPEVASHPDMLFSIIGERHLLTDRRYIEDNKAFFDALNEKDIKITASEKVLSEKYPNDVLFDAIKTQKLLIGNLEHTAPELFSEGINTVNVKQGYALCSTLLMNGAAVSADKGICKALTENGYDVLQIFEGGIVLDGYGYGFIGGASAVLEEQRAVVFFGNIYQHRDGNSIVDFCKSHGYEVRFDQETVLTDYGGVKIV